MSDPHKKFTKDQLNRMTKGQATEEELAKIKGECIKSFTEELQTTIKAHPSTNQLLIAGVGEPSADKERTIILSTIGNPEELLHTFSTIAALVITKVAKGVTKDGSSKEFLELTKHIAFAFTEATHRETLKLLTHEYTNDAISVMLSELLEGKLEAEDLFKNLDPESDTLN